MIEAPKPAMLMSVIVNLQTVPLLNYKRGIQILQRPGKYLLQIDIEVFGLGGPKYFEILGPGGTGGSIFFSCQATSVAKGHLSLQPTIH